MVLHNAESSVCQILPQLAGASIPPTTMAIFPQFSLLPPLSATPQTIFGHCIRNSVQFMRVFSKFWKLAVRDNDPQKYKWS